MPPRKVVQQQRASTASANKRGASPVTETSRRSSKRLKVIEETRASTRAKQPDTESEDADGDDSFVETENQTEDDDVEEETSSDEDIRRRKSMKRGKTGRSQAAGATAYSRTGTGFGPGTEVIRKLPKPRSAGSIPYEDATLHPNTLLFLQDLANHNNREWLKEHDVDFRTSEKDFNSFLEVLSEKIIEKDDTIPELPLRDIKFRIYRDIRFSPDPTPYKPYFSAAWSRTGRRSTGYAAYYLQVEGSRGFIGGGLWQPEAAWLAKLRRAVDRKPRKIKRVLTDAGLRKDFLGGIPENAERAVKAFVNLNREGMLKVKPKDYPKDHPDINILRLRNYTIGRRLTKEEVLGKGAVDHIANLFGSLTPWITYLNSVVRPDEPPSDDDEDEQEEEGEDPN